MESSHIKPRQNRPSPITIPPHAPASQFLPPDSATLRVWAKDKLSIIPAMYSRYDGGMKAIKEFIHQDFPPRYHSAAMQAFYKEFYAVGASSAGTGAELWAHWRDRHRKQVSDFHTPATYSTAEIRDATTDPQHQELSIVQDRRVALDLPTGTSRSPGATKERQLRTSALISEAEIKLLQNRDSNYWGDLATPVWPQSAGKAKVVFIRPKSTRPDVSDQNQYADPDYMIGALSKQETQGIHRRNSLPALRTSLIDDPNAVGGITENSNLGILQTSSEVPQSAIKLQKPWVTAHDTDIPRVIPSVAPLNPKRQYGGNLFSPSTSSFGLPDKSSPRIRAPANSINTFGSGTGIHLNPSGEGKSKNLHSWSERSFQNTPVTGSTFGDTTKHPKRTNLKRADAPETKNTYSPPCKNKSSMTKTDDNIYETNWRSHGLPVHEVYQGHGMMGLHSPVESFMASLNSDSNTTEEVKFVQIRKPRAPGKFLEQLSPIPIPTRESSPSSIYSTPESNYASGFNFSHNDERINTNEQALETFHQSQSNNIDIQMPSRSHRQDMAYQFPGNNLRSLKGVLPKTPNASSTEKSPWQDKPLHPRRHHNRSAGSQTVSNNAPATRNNSAGAIQPIENLDRAPTHIGVEKKLCNSLQPAVLRVTKEVVQDEESDVGIFNRSTFAAHIPRFGKDPMKEINKAHAKGDTKKSTFLRVIQEAVHDGINITRKTPLKPCHPDIAPLRTTLKPNGKRFNKMMISEPINPLKVTNSISTPNLQFNARQIPRVSATTPLSPHGMNTPKTELLPWELDTTLADEDESLSEGDNRDMIHPRPLDVKAPGRSRPAITIDPFEQAMLYSWIECSVVQACSDFLKQQQNELNLDLLRKEVKKWKNGEIKFSTGETRLRDQPIEFMFGMEVQCRLIEGNYRTLHFSGPSAMNPITTISAWKNIIPSFSPRTFCFPDYLVLEHLRVIEKVLNLFGPAYWDNKTFEKKRSETVKRIMDSGQTQKTRNAAAKMEKLQRDRERAEAQLLMEVGILSTEGPVTLEGSQKVGRSEW